MEVSRVAKSLEVTCVMAAEVAVPIVHNKSSMSWIFEGRQHVYMLILITLLINKLVFHVILLCDCMWVVYLTMYVCVAFKSNS